MTHAEALKTTLSSIFRRKGGNGHRTRLFDDLEPPQKQALLTLVSPAPSELPVIGSYQDASNWLLLTTERLTWNGPGTSALPIGEIRDATADLAAMKQRGDTKLQLRRLQVKTMSGGQYTIEVEEGLPLSGTWNVLKNLGARNRGAPSR